jgi:two-component system cell cycle response regulator DivK
MGGGQILVVEDNEKNMKLLRDVLTATGHEVLEASTGDQALALAREHLPGLILMDIQLPDMSGVEALGQLRADPHTALIPVLAVTAQAMKGDREHFMAEGFNAYLSKPIDLDVLLTAVDEHLGAGRP